MVSGDIGRECLKVLNITAFYLYWSASHSRHTPKKKSALNSDFAVG